MFLGARRLTWLFCALPGVAGVAVIACSSSTSREGFDTAKPADTTSSTSSSGATSGGFGGDAAPPSNTDGCSDDAKLVYVLSLEGDLYSFAPSLKKFTKVGPLNCKSGNEKFTPISMAVDRTAVAWVNMRSELDPLGREDTMFKVDTKTAACTPTAIKGPMGGMGFSTNEGTTDKETLFVIGSGSGLGRGLNKVDFAKDGFELVANISGKDDLELTGTGDGRLYGFVQGSPLSLVAINKTSAAFSNNVSLAKVETPESPMYAFSFWGGDFYFYTATDRTTTSTNVTRYRPSDGSIDTSYMKSIGFHIVGAGVSTCAPISVPK